jgi:gluconolactonase
MRVLAAKIGFTEGPVWTSAGELLVTSMSRGLVYRVDLDGAEPSIHAETGGGPNGLAEGADGVVYVAQNGNATMVSRSPRPVEPGVQAIAAGVVDDLVTEGCAAPNDCVVGPDGLLWFTDPPRSPGDAGGRRVCTLDPASGAVEAPIEGIAFPNGLAFGSDADELYVADTEADRILRYRRAGDRMIGAEVFAELPGAGPDGIAFDVDGNLLVAAFDADEVVVLNAKGRRAAALGLPEGSRPTNLCVAGEGLKTLVVTLASGGRVVALGDGFAGRAPSPWIGGA